VSASEKKKQNIINATQFTLESLSTLMDSYSSFVQASNDAEVAKINTKYDAQVTAAGNSSSKLAEIEKARNKELKEQSKKNEETSFKLQLAQAIAGTAMSAINAYSSAAAVPYIGYILAPIAAGVAVAAGTLQVAAISKQHKAAMAAYYTGGYTPSGKWDEVQGAVHSDEFVANRFSTSNSTLRPLFDMVDYAQRNNTVSSLSKKDLANALQLPTKGFSSGGYTNNTQSISKSSASPDQGYERFISVLERVEKSLSVPITASVSILGKLGIKEQQDYYNKLENNASRI